MSNVNVYCDHGIERTYCWILEEINKQPGKYKELFILLEQIKTETREATNNE